jgi:hypothetical protein
LLCLSWKHDFCNYISNRLFFVYFTMLTTLHCWICIHLEEIIKSQSFGNHNFKFSKFSILRFSHPRHFNIVELHNIIGKMVMPFPKYGPWWVLWNPRKHVTSLWIKIGSKFTNCSLIWLLKFDMIEHSIWKINSS